ncbi:MAG: TetR/AcrR family transcriptional regulator [Leptolyngbyaceae cyanobacterium MO_188.B28]|nr:TetR/AcrR family transcriptional regulator [Leptolyngbyaceae cyanobacterium MO_188.B28]
MSRKGRSAKTHEEILDSAWDMIAEQGADVSMLDIAKAVGISRQAIYLHFGTRGGLLMALVKRADERYRIREDFFEALDTRSPAERLDACLRVWLTFVPKILPVAKDLIRLRATDPDASAAWEDRMSDLRSWLRQLAESLYSEGALASSWTIEEATDYIWTASSVQVWDLLVVERNWKQDRAATILRESISKVLLK